MKIRIKSLRKGKNTIEEEVSPEEHGLEDEVFTGLMTIKGEVDNTETMLDVRLHISSRGRFICDRCAVDFVRLVEADLRTYVLFRDAKSQEEAETEGLTFIGRMGAEADLSPEIIEALYLALPMQILCKPECEGLCFKCGADLNEVTCECAKDS